MASFLEFRFDSAAGALSRHGEPVSLTPKAADLLACLIESAGQVRSKRELLERVWPDTRVTEASLKVRISELRGVLGDNPDAPHCIETLPRRGYRWLPDVAQEPGSRRPVLRVALPILRGPRADEPDALLLQERIATLLARWGEFPVQTVRGKDPDSGESGFPNAFTIITVLDCDQERIGVHESLVDEASGTDVWRDRWHLAIKDLAALPILIADGVRLATPHIAGANAATVSSEPVTAWDCVARGHVLVARESPETNAAARSLYERALELEPEVASIWEDVAGTHGLDLIMGWSEEPDVSCQLQLAAAERAVALDPASGGAQCALAAAHVCLRNAPAARRSARAAQRIDPDGVYPRLIGVWVALAIGETTTARAEFEAAFGLGVRSIDQETVLRLGACVALACDEPDAARSAASRAHELAPSWPSATLLAVSLAAEGRNEDAAAVASDQRETYPHVGRARMRQFLGLLLPSELDERVERWLDTALAAS